MKNRIETFIGSQDDVDIKNAIVNKYGNLDMILDDGSHVNQLSFKTFELYWSVLNNGGIYILEDTHCAYLDITESVKGWPGMSYNKSNIDLNNKGEDFENFVHELLLNVQGIKKNIPNLLTFHIYPETLIMLKY